MYDHHDARLNRSLVMTYTVRREYRVSIPPGSGGVASAIEAAARSLTCTPNVDPGSVRFAFEDENGTPC